MLVTFLKKREYKAKDGTALVEVFLLNLEEHTLSALTLELSKFNALGFETPNGTEVIKLETETDGFKVKLLKANYTGQHVKYEIED